MDGILFLIIGLAAGAAAGYAIAALRMKGEGSGHSAEKAELEARAAGLESAMSMLREQAAEKERLLEEARAQRMEELEKRTSAEARLEESRRNVLEQKKLLEDAGEKMTQAFKALSHDALKSNNGFFMDLAQKTLEKLAADMSGDLGKKQEAIAGMVKPLNDALKMYEEHIKGMEMARQKAHTSLEEQIRFLSDTNARLQKGTDNLVNALRKPHVRGKWGELTLRRSAELSGMVEYCDFFEQESARDDAGDMQRPDMVVKLPGGASVIVDAKAPLTAYLDMIEAPDEASRADAMRRHSAHLRTHIKSLSSKEYWRNMENTPEFVVMFLPGESFLSAALEVDRELLEEGFSKKIVIATPTTLIALLRTVAASWRQEMVAEHAKKIIELGGVLYERISVFIGHFEKVGKSLKTASDSYNKAVGSLERNVLSSARRFKELGAARGDSIAETQQIDTAIRALSAPEAPQEESESEQ